MTSANEMFSSCCPQLGLGGGREQRLNELAGLAQAGRQGDAADLAGLLVVQQPEPVR